MEMEMETMSMNCPIHGPQEVIPHPTPTCPTCLANTGQTTLDCPNHGTQVIKAGDACRFCVMESVADRPLHRVHGQENTPIISYFKPQVQKRPKGRRVGGSGGRRVQI